MAAGLSGFFPSQSEYTAQRGADSCPNGNLIQRPGFLEAVQDVALKLGLFRERHEQQWGWKAQEKYRRHDVAMAQDEGWREMQS